MQNLIFSLNATMPVFLMMCLGWFLRRIGLLDDVFASRMNRFVFRVALPVLLFQDLATENFFSVWDPGYVAFCFAATLLSILLVTLCSLPIRDIPARGEFIQASYRSSAALLGAAYIQNIYGNAGMTPLMIIGAVPLYNIAAIVILTLTAQTAQSETRQMSSAAAQQSIPVSGSAVLPEAHRSSLILRTVRSILTNPILIGIAAGLFWSLLRLPLPAIPAKVVGYVSATASPLGLIAMGASIDFHKIGGQMRASLTAVFFKLIGLEALFLPLAMVLGFREEKLVAILVMLGSPTTVTSFVMAKEMGHDGALSSGAVMITTIISAFTLTFWIWLARSLGMI